MQFNVIEATVILYRCYPTLNQAGNASLELTLAYNINIIIEFQFYVLKLLVCLSPTSLLITSAAATLRPSELQLEAWYAVGIKAELLTWYIIKVNISYNRTGRP